MRLTPLKIHLIFSHTNKDLFLGLGSAYETLKENYNDKYEFILPDIVFAKNLFSSSKFMRIFNLI